MSEIDIRVFSRPGVYTFTVEEAGPVRVVMAPGSEAEPGYFMIEAPDGTLAP